jgi:hypothetical protein
MFTNHKEGIMHNVPLVRRHGDNTCALQQGSAGVLSPLPSGVSARGLISTSVQSFLMNMSYRFLITLTPCS